MAQMSLVVVVVVVSLVPRSQFVLTVGVRGLTGKGNRGSPVPGGTAW